MARTEIRATLRIRGWVAPFLRALKVPARLGVPIPQAALGRLIARYGIVPEFKRVEG